MLINPDYSELAELTPGTYKAHIVGAEEKTSQAGKPYVKWKFSTYDAEDARLNNKFVWTNTMLSGPGAFRLKQLVDAVLGKGHTGAIEPETFYGKSVLLTVVEGLDQNGSPTGYAEVKSVRALA